MKRNLVLYVVVAVAGVLVVAGVAFGATYLTVRNMAPAATAAAEGVAEAGEAAAAPISVTKENTVPLKPFTTNLADTERSSYINVTFELVLAEKNGKKELDEKLPLVRDAILRILNSKKSMEVTGGEGANKLKGDILKEVNTMLGGPVVQHVLITDIMVQY